MIFEPLMNKQIGDQCSNRAKLRYHLTIADQSIDDALFHGSKNWVWIWLTEEGGREGVGIGRHEDENINDSPFTVTHLNCIRPAIYMHTRIYLADQLSYCNRNDGRELYTAIYPSYQLVPTPWALHSWLEVEGSHINYLFMLQERSLESIPSHQS